MKPNAPRDLVRMEVVAPGLPSLGPGAARSLAELVRATASEERKQRKRKAMRARYLANRARILEVRKAHRAANRDSINAKKLQRYWAKRDELLALKRQQYAQDPDKFRRGARNWRNRHRSAVNARQRRRYQIERVQRLAYAKRTEHRKKCRLAGVAYVESRS